MFDDTDVLKAQAKSYGAKVINAARWLWSQVPPLHPAGLPFVLGFAFATLLLALIWEGFFVIGLVLTLWCAYFFRDPQRVTPDKDSLVISPADGMVSLIQTVSLPGEFDYDGDEMYNRISIFLNVFDVHIQRVPTGGTIREVIYRPGKFLNACLDKASEDNERSSVLMETADGKKIAYVQIAGLIARRIINGLKAGQTVKAGERYGLIRFGSRVDVYVPLDVKPLVCVGQRVIGGETVLADLTGTQTARTGVVR
jgi:phosphatidylserine decarboxylase